MSYRFHHLVFAGTFDHLHAGHQKLLMMAFSLSKNVSLGITTEKLYRHKPFFQTVEPLAFRKRTITDYLRQKDFINRAKLFTLTEVYGTSISDNSMEAILVTKATSINADKINVIRKKHNLNPLKVIIASYVRGDDGQVITSERIRAGEIDREGKSYLKLFRSTLHLPQSLRAELRKPLGIVVKGDDQNQIETAQKTLHYFKIMKCGITVAVGDIICLSLRKVGYVADIEIIDLRSRRRMLDTKNFLGAKLAAFSDAHAISKLNLDFSGRRDVPPQMQLRQMPPPNFSHLAGPKYTNAAGTINHQAVVAIKKAIDTFITEKKKQTVVIDGEEDLLALPAIILAPLGSVVLYGQMDRGVVFVKVTESKKKYIEKVMKHFTSD